MRAEGWSATIRLSERFGSGATHGPPGRCSGVAQALLGRFKGSAPQARCSGVARAPLARRPRAVSAPRTRLPRPPSSALSLPVRRLVTSRAEWSCTDAQQASRARMGECSPSLCLGSSHCVERWAGIVRGRGRCEPFAEGRTGFLPASARQRLRPLATQTSQRTGVARCLSARRAPLGRESTCGASRASRLMCGSGRPRGGASSPCEQARAPKPLRVLVMCGRKKMFHVVAASPLWRSRYEFLTSLFAILGGAFTVPSRVPHRQSRHLVHRDRRTNASGQSLSRGPRPVMFRGWFQLIAWLGAPEICSKRFVEEVNPRAVLGWFQVQSQRHK